jgi:predicted RNase H-like HicB family nuclease
MREYKYTVIIEPDLDNGGSVATVPVLGIATQGEPLPETRRMVREAISGYIEGRRTEGLPIPPEPNCFVSRIRTERVAVKI